MDDIIILLSSSTNAVRMKEALGRKGYAAKVIQTPSKLSGGGCNYSVRTSPGALPEAENIIKSVNMRSRGIYLDTLSEGEHRYRKLPLGELNGS